MKMRNRRQDFGERKEKDQETKADLGGDMITSRTDYYNTHKAKLEITNKIIGINLPL